MFYFIPLNIFHKNHCLISFTMDSLYDDSILSFMENSSDLYIYNVIHDL